MKSTTNFRALTQSAVAMIVATFAFVACQDYDNGYTEQQLQFIHNFKDIYGEIDQTQDWNMAERANVTVTTSSPSNVKIYAKSNGKYRIVGDYEDVSGTRTLGFDVVEGTTDIMVTDGKTAQQTTVGSSVIFSNTRNIITNKEGKVKTEKTDYYIFDKETYSNWRKYIPEKQFNLGKVSENFIYVSTGEFIIYPVYWRTNNLNTLGIYYIDKENSDNEDGIVYVPIYQIKKNREGDGWDDNNKPDNKGKIGTGEIQHRKNPNGILGEWIDAANDYTPYYLEWGGKDGTELIDGPDEIQAKGIKIDIPVGTVFGMYLKEENNGNVFHSNSDRNNEVGLIYELDDKGKVIINTIQNAKDDTKAAYAATFIDNGKLYIGFEDWVYDARYKKGGDYKEGDDNAPDFDLNDCLFMFGENIPIIVDEGTERWILSAEDLGNTYDIDYNDVVIEVSHLSGRKTAYVTPLAAGGTLASYVYFNDEPIGKGIIGSDNREKTGEIHELFSGDHAKSRSGDYSPINVYSDDEFVYSKRTYKIAVDENFSLASNVPDPDPKEVGKSQNMGGFNIWVLQEGVTVPEKPLTEHDFLQLEGVGKAQKIKNVDFLLDGKNDNVPYVICTPKYWTREAFDNEGTPITEKGHYRWPKEMVPMVQTDGFEGAAYDSMVGHTFKDWVADKTEARDWYKYPKVDQTVAPFGIGIDSEGGFFNPSKKSYLSPEQLKGYELTIARSASGNGYDISYEGTIVKANATSLKLVWAGFDGYQIYCCSKQWHIERHITNASVTGELEFNESDLQIFVDDGGVLKINNNDATGTFLLSVE